MAALYLRRLNQGRLIETPAITSLAAWEASLYRLASTRRFGSGIHSRLAALSFASAASVFLRAINSSGRLVRARFCNGVNSKPRVTGRIASGRGSGDWADW